MICKLKHTGKIGVGERAGGHKELTVVGLADPVFTCSEHNGTPHPYLFVSCLIVAYSGEMWSEHLVWSHIERDVENGYLKVVEPASEEVSAPAPKPAPTADQIMAKLDEMVAGLRKFVEGDGE